MKTVHQLSCLSRVPIFMHLGDAEKEQVHSFLRPGHFKKGEYVTRSGEKSSRLLVLNRGSAKIVRTSKDGREQIVRILKPGDYIGELAVFADIPSSSDVVATDDSSFCMLDQVHLHALLAEKPRLATRLLGDLSTRLEKAETYAESLGMTTASKRLYNVLLEQAAGRESFTLSLPKKDIAANIGVAPETFSRILKKLEHEGRIAVSNKTITLL